MTDTALAIQELVAESDEILPYTLATAHQAGWIWDIPLTQRRGVGFVYSSRHMTEAEAVGSFSDYLGRDLQNTQLRKIPMKIGYREVFWKKNCAALGLAQGFVEPLEATSILVTDFAALLLARNFPKTADDISVVSAHCNKAVSYTWERVIDFVQLHYCISDRRDSPFWIDSTTNPVMSDVLRERLALWKIGVPKKTDFFSSFDIFGVENHLFVLYGMDYPTRPGALGVNEASRSAELVRITQEKSRQMSQSLMPHRAWLTELKKALENR